MPQLSDTPRPTYHPGDYKMYKSLGLYRADARSALGLADATPDSDAEVVMAECITNLGATGGHIRLAPRTTFTFGDTVHPTSSIAISGDRFTTICEPAAGAFAKPLFSYDEEAGTSNRQEFNYLGNLTIDMNGIAGSTCIDHYNLKVSTFENLELLGFKSHAMYMEGFDASSFNFWNTYQNWFFECDTATAAIELHTAFNYDSIFRNIVGTCTATPGMVMYGASNITVDHFHPNFSTNTVRMEPNGDGHAGVCYNNRFYKVINDNNSGHCISLDSDSGNLRDTLFMNPYFLITPNNFSCFELDNDNSNCIRLVVDHATISPSSPGDYEYVVDSNLAAGCEDCRFINGMVPAGGTGSYNNVPTHQIINDIADRTQYYQVIAGPGAAAPTWVGTPPNGQQCVQRNTAGGTSSEYVYSNGAWVLGWTV